MTAAPNEALFRALEKLCRGRPRHLVEEIEQVRAWMGKDRSGRPSWYMNAPKFFSGYTAFHLPIHLPELYWVLEHNVERLGLKAPEVVRDLGSGPGTTTLSLLLWMHAHKIPLPTSVELVDLSERAMKSAKTLISAVAPDLKVKSQRANIFHRPAKYAKANADWLLLAHVLNESGSGPRFRERKLEFLLRAMEENLRPDGVAFVMEPPLREPTLDLMWIRDQVAQDYGDTLSIIAPCPRGARYCPMLQHKMGWCYAQPPRQWARDRKLTLWDEDLEHALHMNLTAPGFSYLVIKRGKPTQWPLHHLAISDASLKNSGHICVGTDAKRGAVPYRGAYLPPPKVE